MVEHSPKILASEEKAIIDFLYHNQTSLVWFFPNIVKVVILLNDAKPVQCWLLFTGLIQ